MANWAVFQKKFLLYCIWDSVTLWMEKENTSNYMLQLLMCVIWSVSIGEFVHWCELPKRTNFCLVVQAELNMYSTHLLVWYNRTNYMYLLMCYFGAKKMID